MPAELVVTATELLNLEARIGDVDVAAREMKLIGGTMYLRSWIAVTMALSAAACGGGTTAVICAPEGIAINVLVRDAVTGAPAAAGATLYATHFGTPSFTDSTRFFQLDSLDMHIGSFGGTYNLRIRKAGYVDWIMNGVVVPTQPNNCGAPAASVVLQVPLQRATQ